MPKHASDYETVKSLSRHFHTLGGIMNILTWDQETYMPEGASSARSDQIQALAGIIHKEKTSDTFSKALYQLIDPKTEEILDKNLSPEQQAAVRMWHRDLKKETALPQQFVEDFAKLTSQALDVWRTAKEGDAFHLFAPYLEKIVAMNRQKADYIGYQDHPYDALLDYFEPDATTGEVSQLFEDIKAPILALLKKIQKSTKVDNSFLHGTFDSSLQISYGKELLKGMGYDFHYGRLDLSTHPFSSSSHPHDNRITSRIHKTSLMSNISAVMHEGGHALYEAGLPAAEFGTPLCEAVSLGIHESQSRFWETRIGLSLPFWTHYYPKLKQTFNGHFDKITLEQFYRGINKVEPSMIRVEADEVTYILHVILRFEIEKELIAGTLHIRDLPDVWNLKMKELLGITPKNFAEGCLQDIHWAMGAFGYFPTYALGNLYASHLFLGFEKAFPKWSDQTAKGDLTFIKEWLEQNVYRHGRRYNSRELLKKATGEEVNAKAHIDYLYGKYNAIYKLS